MSGTEKFAAKALRNVVLSSGSSRGKPAEMLDAAEGRDRAFGIDDLVADESDAEDRDGAALQGFDRQQRVIDRAEPGRSAEDDRKLPLGDEVDLQQLAASKARPGHPPIR